MTTARQLAVGVQKPRNYLINGGFDVWQRGTSQTVSGYGSDDRWINATTASTITHSRQAFTLGQTDVPGESEFYSRTAVTSVDDAGANYARKEQRIEGVRTLAGKTSTVTFWAKADASKDMSVNVEQFFGTGGSPSASVFVAPQKVSLTTSWQKFSLTFAIPSISGKTIGTGGNDFLAFRFWFDAGSNYDDQTDSLGNQSGTFDIARVSLREGDVTALDDPFEERSYGEELALCQRYYLDAWDADLFIDAYQISGGYSSLLVVFPSTMAGSPTVSVTNSGSLNVSTFVGSGATPLQFRLEIRSSGTGRFYITGGGYRADAEL